MLGSGEIFPVLMITPVQLQQETGGVGLLMETRDSKVIIVYSNILFYTCICLKYICTKSHIGL